MQLLHEMQVIANRYMKDSTQEDPVWLHAKMANETGERRALVHSISVQYKSSWFGTEATVEDMPLVVTIVRGPYWESPTARDLPDSAPSAAACVVYDYTAAGDVVPAHDIAGDTDARLRYFITRNNGVDEVSRFWMGIRSANKHGATGISNFVNTWELEDGVINANESGITDESDATASGGNMVEVTETDLDWDAGTFLEVLYTDLNRVTSNNGDQFGDFLWLLRAKVDSGTWEVRLSFAYGPLTAEADTIKTDIIEITNTSWRFLDVAPMPIPLRNIHAITPTDVTGALGEDFYTIKVYARRTDGSGDLNLDCLIPLPIDEGFIKTEYSTAGTADLEYQFGESPEGICQVIAGFSTYLYRPGSIEGIYNFRLPPGDGRMYCVYERDASSDLTDTILINSRYIAKYYERWLSLRGIESADLYLSASEEIEMGDAETVAIP
jgi:hypothetical protein